jgi:hypothetical protein
MTFASFWQLQQIGHYRLKHKWQSMDGLTIGNSFSKNTPFPLVSETGEVQYHTERCNMRGCWACEYRKRSKLKEKVNNFVRTTVNKARKAWRFVTFTLPGSWYEARHADLESQLKIVKTSWRSYRQKMKYRGIPINGFYTIELAGGHSKKREWHAHIHVLQEWVKFPFDEARRLWTESVDKKMRKQLSSWTEGKFTNDSRSVQVDEISDASIADYLTKVTNYVTKGPQVEHNAAEVSQILYGKRTTGWLGRYYGTKSNQFIVKRKSGRQRRFESRQSALADESSAV